MSDPIHYVLFQSKTVFMPLRYVYGECWLLIEEHEKMYPLRCMNDNGCPVKANCAERISRRVHYLFDQVLPGDVEMLVAYFRYRDTKSVRASIFHRDMRAPTVQVVNPYALKKFLREGTTYKWFPSTDYMLKGSDKRELPVIL